MTSPNCSLSGSRFVHFLLSSLRSCCLASCSGGTLGPADWCITKCSGLSWVAPDKETCVGLLPTFAIPVFKGAVAPGVLVLCHLLESEVFLEWFGLWIKRVSY